MALCVFPISHALRGFDGEGSYLNLVDYAQLDAFTDEAFKGNPAAVCLLPSPRDDWWMQNVAKEFNYPMTAFVQRRSNLENGDDHGHEDRMDGAANGQASNNFQRSSEAKACEYDIRFFTAVTEVPLCGHALLASAYLLFKSALAAGLTILFHTKSGLLEVRKILQGDGSKKWQGQVEISFPFVATTAVSSALSSTLTQTLGSCEVVSTHKTATGLLILELPSAKEVEILEPCLEEILSCDIGALIVTGRGSAESPYDFVSRVFGPKIGIPEDEVTGTAHCALAPLWAMRLGKQRLLAYQASKRGGVLDLNVDQDARRVNIRGTATIVTSGVLFS